MRRFVLPAILVLSVSLAARPGQTPATQGQAPTFRAESTFIEIDALPTDKAGKFVADLTRDDFQVEEDGQPQKVTVFSLVDIPIAHAESAAGSPVAAVDPDVATNVKPSEGRVYLLVLDSDHVSPQRTSRVKSDASDFVEHYMGPTDFAAVVDIGDPRANQEFTSIKTRLLASIDRFSGNALDSITKRFIDDSLQKQEIWEMPQPRMDPGPACDPDDAQRAARAIHGLQQIEEMAGYLGTMTGRRKAMMLFSQGLDYDLTEVPASQKCGNSIFLHDSGSVRDAIDRMVRTSSLNNVNIYTIDPRGLSSGQEDGAAIGRIPNDERYSLKEPVVVMLADETTKAQDSLRIYADETGGRAFVNKNDLAGAFQTIVADSSRYYLLGYESRDQSRTGKYHRLSVKVRRPGVDVAARKGYYAPTDNKPGTKSSATPGATAADPIVGVLTSPMPVTGLGMHINAVVTRNTANLSMSIAPAPPKKKSSKPAPAVPPPAAVRLTVEFDGHDLSYEDRGGVAADDVAVEFQAWDADGVARARGHQVVHLNLKPDTRKSVTDAGLRYVADFAIGPGHYQLRVAAREEQGGHAGSVFYDLDVPDFVRAPIAASGLTVSSTAADRIITGRQGKKGLGGDPGAASTLRAFDRADVLTGAVTIYASAEALPAAVDLHVRVVAEDGHEIFTRDDHRQTADIARDPAGYSYQVSVPLTNLAPGLYVFRVSVVTVAGTDSLVRETVFRVQ